MMSTPAVIQPRQLVTDTSSMPLQAMALRCEAAGGLSQVVLEQCFANTSALPLHVTYTLPLPADGAVSGFRFRIGEKTIVGDVDRKQAARERFEQAILSGQTAALLEEERSSLFTQEIGNVPPGAEVIVEITIDLKLKWLAEGMWELRFPLAAAPRYLGAAGRVQDASKNSFDVAEASSARASLALHVRDAVSGGRSPESPSHPLSCVADGEGFRVELGSGNAVLPDRDVVVRWSVSSGKIGISCDVAGPRASLIDAHALITIVPPQQSAQTKSLARDLTFLLDTSGSMGGAPIAQAQKIVLAMLSGLQENDRFELIEFSNMPRRFRSGLSAATHEEKSAAAAWVRSLRASGGTEMREGILEALRPTAERTRNASSTHVVLITDGLIGFEKEIVSAILALLPGGARLHTVGVGSSVNRSLTSAAARAGRGIEVVLGLGEDPDRAAHRLRAHSEMPLVVEVEVSGSALVATAPIKAPDLFAGAPVLLSAKVLAQGGELILRGKTADSMWEERVQIPRSEKNSGSNAVITFFGRESVEDAEMKIAAGQDVKLLDASIEAIGLAYKISTRLTSWVAIDPSVSVDPRDPSRRIHQPQMLPHGISAEGVGLRPMAAMAPMPAMAYGAPAPMAMPARPRMAMPPSSGGMLRRPAPAPQAPPPAESAKKKETLDAPVLREERTFVSRIKDAIFGSDDESLAEESAPATTRAPLRGRITLRKSGEVVVEFAVQHDTDIQAREVTILFADGSTALARRDVTRSTRSGLISAGSTFRLVLEFSPSFDGSTIASIEIETPLTAIVIEIGS